jgi:hypothetical protein
MFAPQPKKRRRGNNAGDNALLITHDLAAQTGTSSRVVGRAVDAGLNRSSHPSRASRHSRAPLEAPLTHHLLPSSISVRPRTAPAALPPSVLAVPPLFTLEDVDPDSAQEFTPGDDGFAVVVGANRQEDDDGQEDDASDPDSFVSARQLS